MVNLSCQLQISINSVKCKLSFKLQKQCFSKMSYLKWIFILTILTVKVVILVIINYVNEKVFVYISDVDCKPQVKTETLVIIFPGFKFLESNHIKAEVKIWNITAFKLKSTCATVKWIIFNISLSLTIVAISCRLEQKYIYIYRKSYQLIGYWNYNCQLRNEGSVSRLTHIYLSTIIPNLRWLLLLIATWDFCLTHILIRPGLYFMNYNLGVLRLKLLIKYY